MIENVTKSVRRKATVDDVYIDKLYSDMNSLYRLDQKGSTSAGKTELGPLPTEAKALIIALVAVWAAIGIYSGVNAYKKYFRKKKTI